MTIAVMEHIGADGTFTEGFAGSMISELGEGYVEATGHDGCKALDDIHDIKSLAKSAIDFRRKNTTLAEAAKHAINRPAEGASDDDRANYKRLLRTELGATGVLADYKYGKPDDTPEGLPYNEEQDKALAEFCCNEGIPVDVYQAMREVGKNNAYAAFNAAGQRKTEAFESAASALKEANSPDKLAEMGRLAFRYIEHYCTDDQKTAVNGMFEKPGDLAEWNTRGISPVQMQHMAKVMASIQPGKHKQGDGPGGATAEEKADTEFVKAVNAKSPAMQPGAVG